MIAIGNFLIKKENVILLIEVFFKDINKQEKELNIDLYILLNSQRYLLKKETFEIKNITNFYSTKIEEVKTLIEECKIETQILIKLYDEIKNKRKLSKIDLKQIIQNIALKYMPAIQLEFQKQIL